MKKIAEAYGVRDLDTRAEINPINLRIGESALLDVIVDGRHAYAATSPVVSFKAVDDEYGGRKLVIETQNTVYSISSFRVIGDLRNADAINAKGTPAATDRMEAYRQDGWKPTKQMACVCDRVYTTLFRKPMLAEPKDIQPMQPALLMNEREQFVMTSPVIAVEVIMDRESGNPYLAIETRNSVYLVPENGVGGDLDDVEAWRLPDVGCGDVDEPNDGVASDRDSDAMEDVSDDDYDDGFDDPMD